MGNTHKLPIIPQKGSHQYDVVKRLIEHANDNYLKHVWVTGITGMTHEQMVKAISKLREEKGWPIEDVAELSGRNGYRLDKERWAVIKNKISL